MTRDLRQSDHPTWQLKHYQLKELLGLPTNKLPADFELPPTLVGNVKVFITKSKGTYSQHRVYCHCPRCDKVVSAGRLQQHMKVHKA